ncbi:MAG: hypothetical protein ABIA93_00055 [Candidatus Woesearchaeota archaeon]
MKSTWESMNETGETVSNLERSYASLTTQIGKVVEDQGLTSTYAGRFGTEGPVLHELQINAMRNVLETEAKSNPSLARRLDNNVISLERQVNDVAYQLIGPRATAANRRDALKHAGQLDRILGKPYLVASRGIVAAYAAAGAISTAVPYAGWQLLMQEPDERFGQKLTVLGLVGLFGAVTGAILGMYKRNKHHGRRAMEAKFNAQALDSEITKLYR